jgi:hypothetical protein
MSQELLQKESRKNSVEPSSIKREVKCQNEQKTTPGADAFSDIGYQFGKKDKKTSLTGW